MKASKIGWALVILGAAACLMRGAVSARESSPCQPPDLTVAVYNFVPERQLQTFDFRPLMKTESSFVAVLRQTPNVDLSDYTTTILPAEIEPDPPNITENLQPPPAQTGDAYFFTGQITKTGNAFTLVVQLKKSADATLLHEVKTTFESASEAEKAGKTAADAMVAFFATQAQNARDNRATGDHAVDPHIELIIDRLRLRPNETSPVKIVLTDCDGTRLKHRRIEAFLQLKHGGTPVQEENLVRETDDKGERNGDIGAKSPGVITYIAKFKYKDVMGVPRECTASKTIVVAGDGMQQWQLRADVSYEKHSLYFTTDKESGRWSGKRYQIRKKASFVFVFTADDGDPSGDVATDAISDYNGYGEVYRRNKTIDAQEESELRVASGLVDQGQDASQALQAGFSISPSNNEFQASLHNVRFVGSDEQVAVRLHPYNYTHKTGIEFREEMGADGGTQITPEMKKSGVYTFHKFERTPIDQPENSALRTGGTKGYEITQYDFEVRKLKPNGGDGLIKK